MKSKLKIGILFASILSISSSIGGVFASYTITDNANRIGSQIGLQIPTREIYLKAGVWDVDDPTYFAHCYNGGNDYDVKLTACETNGFYKFSVKITYQNVVFVRDPTSTASIDWDNLWNKTADLSFDLTKDTYEITGWGENKISTGQWINHNHDAKSSYSVITAATAIDCAVKREIQYCGICGEILSENTFIDHTHLTEHAASAATCTQNGNLLYYSCDHCDKYYSDSAAQNEITDKPSVVINATGHSFTNNYGSDATNHWLICDHDCGATDTPEAHTFVNGVCNVCGYVQAHVHNYVNHPAIAATCTTAGNSQYYTCSGCTHIFDSNYNEIASVPTIAALGHNYVDHKCSRDGCGAIESGYTQVHFTCNYGTGGNGDLYIAGIGGWDNFIPMNWTTGDNWILDKVLETGSSISFKVVIKWKSGTDEWETRSNRDWTIPDTETTYICNWNS